MAQLCSLTCEFAMSGKEFARRSVVVADGARLDAASRAALAAPRDEDGFDSAG
jgi:hypothetical protein